MEKENTPLSIVKYYYNQYKNYSKAYENASKDRKNLTDELREHLESGNSEEEGFKNIALQYITNFNTYSKEVENRATNFVKALDFYNKLGLDEIDGEIKSHYNMLKTTEYKSAYSVVNGVFKRNSDVKLPEIPQKEFDYIFDYFKNMMV